MLGLFMGRNVHSTKMSVAEREWRGFTLIELVMVIVIIGLLASIIVPKFQSQKMQAGVAATKANLESLRTAIEMYYANEEDYPVVPGMSELWDGSSPSGTVYMRAIPETETYDPGQTIPTGPCNTISDTAPAIGSCGWYWDSAATPPELHPRLVGSDVNGDLFIDY